MPAPRTDTDYYDKYISGWPLNNRQRALAELVLKVGFRKAVKMTGYAKLHAYKLLRSTKFQRYQMSLLGDAFSDVGLTLGGLIKKRLELADRKGTPEKLSDDIYKDLIGMAREAGEGVDEAMRLVGGDRKVLKPSKDIKDANFEDITEDGDNGRIKEGRLETTDNVSEALAAAASKATGETR